MLNIRFKRALGFVGAALLSSHLVAGDIFPFIGYEYAGGSEENVKIFGGQPMKELVGDRDTEHTLKLGLTSDMRNFNASKWQARAYALVWSAPNANDEVGFGVGADYILTFSSVPSLGLVVGGSIGYGWQDTKGKTVTVSTDASKVGFIMNKPIHHGSYKATFLEDNANIKINLELGLTYHVSKSLSFDLKYRLANSRYDMSYYVHGVDSLNTLSKGVYAHLGVVGLNFHF